MFLCYVQSLIQTNLNLSFVKKLFRETTIIKNCKLCKTKKEFLRLK